MNTTDISKTDPARDEIEDFTSRMASGAIECVTLPRGVTVFYKHLDTTIDHDGAIFDDEGIELVKAFKNGPSIPVDDYDLLQETASEIVWNRF